jgi:hypothetical protein
MKHFLRATTYFDEIWIFTCVLIKEWSNIIHSMAHYIYLFSSEILYSLYFLWYLLAAICYSQIYLRNCEPISYVFATLPKHFGNIKSEKQTSLMGEKPPSTSTLFSTSHHNFFLQRQRVIQSKVEPDF